MPQDPGWAEVQLEATRHQAGPIPWCAAQPKEMRAELLPWQMQSAGGFQVAKGGLKRTLASSVDLNSSMAVDDMMVGTAVSITAPFSMIDRSAGGQDEGCWT